MQRVIKVAALSALIVATAFVISLVLHGSSPDQSNDPVDLRAAIIDQLSLTVPNQTFVAEATEILEEAGYTVSYYEGEEVTVDFYRKLPTHGYSLIILRVHSGLRSFGKPPVSFFTSEPFDGSKHTWELFDDRLCIGQYSRDGQDRYFGIAPKFAALSMKGELKDTVVVAMGCDSLSFADMAEAFVHKGAKAYIGWNGPVLASYMDSAIIQLLKHLVTANQPINQAIEQTMNEVGADPLNESILAAYP